MKICFLAEANSVHSYRWIKYSADKGYEIHSISLATASDCGSEIKNLKLYLTPYPKLEKTAKEVLSLPIYPELSKKTNFILQKITFFFKLCHGNRDSIDD